MDLVGLSCGSCSDSYLQDRVVAVTLSSTQSYVHFETDLPLLQLYKEILYRKLAQSAAI